MPRSGERATLIDHASARRRAEEEEPGMAVSGPRGARWPVLVIAAVLAAGALDGAARAHFGSPSHDALLGLASRTPRVSAARRTQSLLQEADSGAAARGAARVGAAMVKGGVQGDVAETHVLVQRELGEECTAHWNCFEWLVCRDGVCSSCETNTECQERNPSRQCFSDLAWAVEGDASQNVCKHKPLFFPLTWADISMAILTFLTIGLSAPTGTGGGGILVPIYMILGEFAAHSAVPLSKATILGGAIATNVINLQRRHPFANRPIIDFDAIQLLVPSLLAGTIFGVIFNAVAPDWLITIGLVIALGYSGMSAANKAWALYAEEVRNEEREAEPLIGGGSKQRELPARHYSFDTEDNLTKDMYEVVKEESKINFKALGVVTAAWALVLTCSLIKGGSGSHRLVPCGSLEFFFIAFLPVPIILALSWRLGVDVHERFERKRIMGFRFADGDPLWTYNHVRHYSLIAVAIGVGAGALGIAAGTLLSPLLLSAGLNPLVTVASTGLMVMYTSSSTAAQYLILGRLQYDYAAAFMIIGVISAVVGNTIINYAVRKYRKTWFVIAILAASILLSMVLLGYLGLFRTLRSYLEGEDMGFHDMCSDRAHMLASADPPRKLWNYLLDLV